MKVIGYLTNVAHKSWESKNFIEGDVEGKHISFWPKKDKEIPQEGEYLEVEYIEKTKGNFTNLLAQDWAIRRDEPPTPPQAQPGQVKGPDPWDRREPDRWATLPPKEHLMARENATKNATALVVAEIQAGLLKDSIEQRLEHWFQVSLQLLFQGSVVPPVQTELDVAMEAALAWAETHNIHPALMDKFVGAYKVSHNLTTLEVLTLLNSGHFDPSVVELAGE